jgi:hypothetical protein
MFFSFSSARLMLIVSFSLSVHFEDKPETQAGFVLIGGLRAGIINFRPG